MNALEELKKRAPLAAIPAIPAVQEQQVMAESQKSQESQEVKYERHFLTPAIPVALAPLADILQELRARLLTLATANHVDEMHVQRLSDIDLASCNGLEICQLEAYLAMLVDTDHRHAGRIPPEDTAPMHCLRCGPVWIHPDIAEVLPVVAGWPHALGCPWCFVRRAGGYIPRPRVTCSDCRHFTPHMVHRHVVRGTCASGGDAHLPMAEHVCERFSVSPEKGI